MYTHRPGLTIMPHPAKHNNKRGCYCTCTANALNHLPYYVLPTDLDQQTLIHTTHNKSNAMDINRDEMAVL